jgi:hypothetical protein
VASFVWQFGLCDLLYLVCFFMAGSMAAVFSLCGNTVRDTAYLRFGYAC